MRRAAALVAIVTLTLSACTAGRPHDTVGSTAAPSPSTAAGGPELLTVDPSLIDGLDVSVDESLATDQYLYVAYPVLPGGSDLTGVMRDAIAWVVDRYKEVEHSSDGEARPELTVSWDIVGASPEALGVRLASAEVGAESFDGNAQTVWIDLAERAQVLTRDLFREERLPTLMERIVEAGQDDPRIDEQRFNEQMDGEIEAFDSVAFTPGGDLWIEFDRAQVSTSTVPVGVAVDPDGLLSDFGLLAQESALSPTEPALEAPEPTTAAPDVPAPAQTQAASDDHDCAVLQCLALTFDDGPVAGTTELLDVLASRGVKATFFMVGKNAAANPDVVRRVVEEGHAVGSHTWDHPQLTRLDADSVRSEIARAADAIEEASGVRPALLRPPYGATNDTVASVAAELGMAQILWDVDPEDWKDKDADIVTERVLSRAHRNAIVLSHDIHPTTRDAYAAIIDALLADGYTLVTVPDLIDDLEPGVKHFSGG